MRFAGIRRAATVLAVLALAMTGCIFGAGDCGFEPIGASIRPPIVAPVWPDSVGQCGQWVTIDGAFWSQSNYDFVLDAETLEPIGEATEAARGVVDLEEATIYAIPGVSSDEAVAMETPDGSFVVFTYGSSIPTSLCPLLAPTGNPEVESCNGT